MKIFQKFAVVVAILAMVVGAKAGALYWQVDTAASDAAYTGSFDSAALFVSDGTFIDGAVAAADGKVAPTLSDLGSYGSSSYSFYVELYDSAGGSVYKGAAVSYDQLMGSGYISTGGVSLPNFTATSGFNGASVPEPTSGMLLLMGGALLALRRRRQ